MNNFEHGLSTLMITGDLEGCTVKEYLGQLLYRLWVEGESFKSKAPFGNSGWDNDLIYSLLNSGAIEGEIDRDDDGYINDAKYDTDKAYIFVGDMIKNLFI